MEPSAILLIMAPLFHPIAMSLGIDPIHLGIIMTTNMEVGMITPPVGLNLYVAAGMCNMSLGEVTKGGASVDDGSYCGASYHHVCAVV